MSTAAAHHFPIPHAPKDGIGEAIRDATSHDLVFAVVGHAGAGASRVAYALIEGLQSNGYEAQLVKISKLIAETARHLAPGKWNDIDSSSRLKKIVALQEVGNWLRTEYFPSFTAAVAIKCLRDSRHSRGAKTKPIAFVLDSLKNPEEVDALRKVYGRSFYLVSVVCGPEVRRTRLKLKFKDSPPDEITALMDRDEAEDTTTGQQVRKTIHVADFFVNNQADHSPSGADPVDDALARFLQIVSATEVVRPTRDERGMHAAWAAGLRSSCMSRQVGAAILDAEGELVATGTNDVPRAGGGLYEEMDVNDIDARCFAYPKPDDGEPHGFCRSDKQKSELLQAVGARLRSAGLLKDEADAEAVDQALRQTALADLIEFSRAVHAEMDAIVTLARTGAGRCRSATLYCTTYPCHLCARHIVAAGIREVVYYEPYTKSRAIVLHDDSIEEATTPATSDGGPVRFRLFAGVAPRRFAALFEKRRDLKVGGRRSLPVAEGVHTDPIFTKTYLEFEETIARTVEQRTAGQVTVP